jgi:cation:H+ antiporter
VSLVLGIAKAAVGLLLLVAASDRFVAAAARLAQGLGVSPLVAGVVVVGFGTSLPELLSSLIAASEGSLGLAAGSVIGSNTANATLITGLAGLVGPPLAAGAVLRFEAPVAFGACVAFALGAGLGLGRVEGAAGLVAFALAVAFVVRRGRVAPLAEADPLGSEVRSEYPPAGRGQAARDLASTLAGLLGTLVGAALLVSGARGLAARAGVSDAVVGFLLVGLGTSLPELVTSIHAARRGEGDLVVGNVLGSNLFNSLVVGGTAALVRPGQLPARVTLVPGALMVAAMGGLWLLLATGGRLRRGEAVLLVCAYAGAVVATLA